MTHRVDPLGEDRAASGATGYSSEAGLPAGGEGRLICVVTSIQPPTPAVESLSAALSAAGAPLIVLGDESGPKQYELEDVRFWSLERQRDLPYALAAALPRGHYSRKNLGYLVAAATGATCIYETDDDNSPLPSWRPRGLVVEAVAATEPGWCNVFRAFTEELVWPRGFPIGQVGPAGERRLPAGPPRPVPGLIQQGLADGSPDVDAIWRLAGDREVWFRPGPSLVLGEGVWSPFNSQSTWWWEPAYELIYLPATASFRMTDIVRSYVAQRCLWTLGAGVVVHGAEVRQHRNAHDLRADLRLELPGYVHAEEAARRLESLDLECDAAALRENVERCYRALVPLGLVGEDELELLPAWFADLSEARARCVERQP